MDSFLVVAGQVLVLFLLMGVGAAMRRFRLLTDAAAEGLVNLLILVVTPCLIVDVFRRPFDPEQLQGLAKAFGLTLLAHAAVIAVALLLVRHRDEDVRRPLLLAAVFSNAGFMGLPLEQSLLGEIGVFYGAVYVATFNLVIWSWGCSTMRRPRPDESGAGIFRLKSVVNPGTIGLALGLPVFLLSVELPQVVAEPVHLLASLNTPVAMIVIGYHLLGARLGKVVRMWPVYVASAIRLVLFPLMVMAMLYPLRHWLPRELSLAMTIAASAPVAAMVSMFAAKYGRDVDVAVAMATGTTLVSIVTMPAIIAFAMSIF